MTVTTWPDISEWQPPLSDAFTGPLVCSRASLSTYKTDNHIGINRVWQQRKVLSGQLAFEFYYHVWYPGNEAAQYDTAMRAIGGARPGLVFMLDIESWSGAIHGDNTASIDKLRLRFATALGSPLSVPVYGNTGDLRSIYPGRPSTAPTILASYGSAWWSIEGNQIAQQYTNGVWAGPAGLPVGCAPFGRCDFNGARMSVQQLRSRLGLTSLAPASAGATEIPATPVSLAKPKAVPDMYEVLLVDGSGEWFMYSPLVFQHIADGAELVRVIASPLNANGKNGFRHITRIDRENYRNIVTRNQQAIRGAAA